VPLLCAVLWLAGGGCRVGPNYARPAVPLGGSWVESARPEVHVATPVAQRWWKAFDDPVLTRLVQEGYRENLSLRAAGLRVIQAQARRAIAIGDLFPQEQTLSGAYLHSVQSANTAFGAFSGRNLDTWQAGFDTVWELDLWGKFRRAVEAADAELLAAVAGYDDVLVSLVAEVATNYVALRSFQERLGVARDNVRVQTEGLEIARVRFEAGATSELDVQQARTLLKDTEATIPQIAIQARRATYSIAALLGRPPSLLANLLGPPGHVPKIPSSVAVGIPAELLMRRPDVRRAEYAAAAQCARIGVSFAELLPAFELNGTVGLSAEDVSKFFEGRSFQASTGPSFQWPILNYGRLTNDVRLQDAAFQELLVGYANTVVTAEQEVENALVGYLRGTEQTNLLAESVAAAQRAVELSLVQYREGATDYTSVLNTQQAKLHEEDLLVNTRAAVALSTIALFKALGGGWILRAGHDFVPKATREEMADRTSWGRLLSPPERARDIRQASGQGPWWRRWWPRW
jgi:NodT family efflux transporter outer membrane factor (OMF) lipoprotein